MDKDSDNYSFWMNIEEDIPDKEWTYGICYEMENINKISIAFPNGITHDDVNKEKYVRITSPELKQKAYKTSLKLAIEFYAMFSSHPDGWSPREVKDILLGIKLFTTDLDEMGYDVSSFEKSIVEESIYSTQSDV